MLPTHTQAWLQSSGFPVIEGLATFYASRVVANTDGSFSITRTMGPDEYHGNVTDSVYSNAVARLTLQAAVSLVSGSSTRPAARTRTHAPAAALPPSAQSF